ncbi:unnamed protein product [Lampetra fluviatilis]
MMMMGVRDGEDERVVMVMMMMGVRDGPSVRSSIACAFPAWPQSASDGRGPQLPATCRGRGTAGGVPRHLCRLCAGEGELLMMPRLTMMLMMMMLLLLLKMPLYDDDDAPVAYDDAAV